MSAAAGLAVVCLASCLPAAARAQAVASIALESDYRVRGRSVSDERPVATARLGYDDPNGVYVEGSASVVASRHDGARFLGYQFDAGVAKRLGPLWTIDLGIAHDDFRAPYPGGSYYKRSEAYVGVLRGPFSAYVFAAPSYGHLKTATLYEQLEASVPPVPGWRLTAHVGALELLDAGAPFSSLYDWRLGVAREIGHVEVHAAVSGNVPGHQAYRAGVRSRTAVTAGASYSF